MFEEIEGNVDGIVPVENVVQYLTIMSQDNRKIKVKIILRSLFEDYKDTQINFKKFTVKTQRKLKVTLLCYIYRKSLRVWSRVDGSPITKKTQDMEIFLR